MRSSTTRRPAASSRWRSSPSTPDPGTVRIDGDGDLTPPVPLPPGRLEELPGRGTTFVRELEGPPDAPALVLIHGWLANSDLNWYTSYAPLGRRFRVVAMDQRGHGRGIRPNDRFRLTDCADDVAALIRHLDLAPAIPVGYSMGGGIAQLVVHRHRELVRGIVLCSTGARFRGRPRERAAFGALEGLEVALGRGTDHLHDAVQQRIARRRHAAATPAGRWARNEFKRSDLMSLLQAGRDLGRFSSREWLADLDVPAAVVMTDRDRILPPARQRELAAAIPTSTVHHVPGDHTACVDQSEDFLAALLEACEIVSERSAAAPRVG